MERREEGGLTEKEKARNEEESKVTESKRLFSKLVRQFYYRVIKKKGKKKGKRVRERIEGYFASLHFTDLLISANLAINLLPGFGCKSVGFARCVEFSGSFYLRAAERNVIFERNFNKVLEGTFGCSRNERSLSEDKRESFRRKASVLG